MNDLDLSGVDPLKWAEVRRRAAAVRRYLELERPTAADREYYARQIGIGAQQFNTLVRAWAIHQDANALSPGVKRTGRKSKSKDGGVHPQAREVAAALVAQKGETSTLNEMVAAVAERCAKLGIPAPARSTVWMLMKEAQESSAAPGGNRILVGRAFLKLPVDGGDGLNFPEVMLAVQLPQRRILGATMAVSGDVLDFADIAELVRTFHADGEYPIHVDERDLSNVLRCLPIGTKATPLPRGVAAREMSAAIGRNLGLIGIAYQAPTIRPATIMQSGRDKAPSFADATLALKFAVDRHNKTVVKS